MFSTPAGSSTKEFLQQRQVFTVQAKTGNNSRNKVDDEVTKVSLLPTCMSNLDVVLRGIVIVIMYHYNCVIFLQACWQQSLQADSMEHSDHADPMASLKDRAAVGREYITQQVLL